MNIEDIQAPEWANKEHTAINCRVKFAEFDAFLPFTACQNDFEEHGRRIYSELESGKYGPVAPFIMTDKMVEDLRNQKLTEINNWRDVQENANIIFEFDGQGWRQSIAGASCARGYGWQCRTVTGRILLDGCG